MEMKVGLKMCLVMLIGLNVVEGRSAGKIKRSHTPNAIIKHNDPLSDTLASSVELALENCQESFKWDKWNCPSNSFLSKRSSHHIDREQAFVKALTTASFIYTVAKNCSTGNEENCGCNTLHHNFANDLTWTGCKNFLNTHDKTYQNASRDAQSFANFHNARAGKIAIKNSLKKLCRCHGVSGSCALQTCWQSINAFPAITSEIKRMYDNSVMLWLDNSGNVDFGNVREDQLVYLVDSPNYCRPNAVPGWKGTIGRHCSRAKGSAASTSKRHSCKHLCKSCGYQVRKRQKVVQKKCNYKFRWCCEVTYDVCDETVDEFYCE